MKRSAHSELEKEVVLDVKIFRKGIINLGVTKLQPISKSDSKIPTWRYLMFTTLALNFVDEYT